MLALVAGIPCDLPEPQQRIDLDMAVNPTPRLVTEFKPKYEVKVDLDDSWANAPSADYLRLIREGYEALGFDQAILLRAVERSLR